MKKDCLSFLLIATIWITVALQCSSGVNVAGGTIETTNGDVKAMAIYPDGKPASRASVRLRRSDYLAAIPSLSKSALYSGDVLTDSNGRFEITGVDPGSYRIEVGDGQSAVLFACSLDVNDTVNLGVDTLRPYSTVTGTVDTAGRGGQLFYVQVDGLERLAAVDASGKFALSDLPAGKFTVRAITAHDTMIAAASNVGVGPGESTNVTMLGGWLFSKRIYLNTTASGANVNNDVTGFPLLVRLDSVNFNFSQVQTSGIDLMFVDSGSRALPFEIEQWDEISRQAVIWVAVDTIRGNDAKQFIVMLWGSDSIAALSGSAGVFDSAAGYVGVWHFDSHNPGTDATGNGFTARDGGTRPLSGIIGDARFFNGDDTMMISDTASLEPSSFTISCWFKRKGAQNNFAKLVSKGKDDSAFASYTLELRQQNNVAGFQIATLDTNVRFVQTPQVIEDTTWYFLTGVYNGLSGIGELFLNGVSQGTFVSTAPIDYYPARQLTLNFGGIKGSRFVGTIDEVRLSNRVLSSDYIKLTYENQRSGSNLVAVHGR